jgi:hypothetical protein
VVRHGDEALAAAERGGSQAGGEIGGDGGRRQQVERHGWDLGQCLCLLGSAAALRAEGKRGQKGRGAACRKGRPVFGKLSKFGRIKVELWARYLL